MSRRKPTGMNTGLPRITPSRLVVLAVLFACVLAGGLFGVAAGESADDQREIVLVSFESELTGEFDDIESRQAEIERAQQPLVDLAETNTGITIQRQFWIANVAAVAIDHDRLDRSTIEAVDGVEAVRENVKLSGEFAEFTAESANVVDTPSHESLPVRSTAATSDIEASWGLTAIDAPTVWQEYGTRGEGVTVAVLDSGVDTTHPEIDIVGWGDWDTDGNARDTEPQDYDTAREPSGHGTHVTGTIIAEDRSTIHLGVAPDADVMAGAALTDCDASGCDATAAQILAGIEWAVENDADVLTISIGLETKYDRFIEPIRNAQDAGTVVIASGGNDGFGSSTSPGNDYDSISVGAADTSAEIIDMSGGEIVFSETEWNDPPADWPELYLLPKLAAPGWQIPSTIVSDQGDYSRGTGTSFAAPHVAGSAALIQSATDERLTPEEIETVLIKTAYQPTDDAYPNIRYGHGIINAADAVELAVDGTYDPANIEPSVPENIGAAIPDDQEDEVPDEAVEEPDEDEVADDETADDEESTDGETAEEDDGDDATTDDDGEDATADDNGDGAATDDTTDGGDGQTGADDDGPGFGIGIALLSLIASTLVAGRRTTGA